MRLHTAAGLMVAIFCTMLPGKSQLLAQKISYGGGGITGRWIVRD